MGSQSYAPKPTGMSEEKEEQLRKCGNLFQEPDSTLLLASGMGRHWPDGRGVFENNNKNLFVWVGEEDHLRIVSMQGSRDAPSAEGKNIKEVTARFMNACAEVQKVLKAEGADFMHNDHLGWVLTCPSNLGTGLRAGTMVKLPKVSARDDWKALCAKMGLQARGTGGVDSANVGGTWDVSNADRIGKGEVDLVNTLIEGAAQLVKWESLCDNGKQDEAFAEIDAKLSGAAPAAEAPAAEAPAAEAPAAEAPAAQEAAAYTMVYFGLRSRGEPPRLVAAYSGVTIENKALSPEEWGAFKADGAKPEEERTDNKAGIQSLPYVIHPDGKMQAETLDVMQIFATAGGRMVDDADTRAIGDNANSIANFIDPYLNLDQATRDAFGITTPQNEAFAQAAEAFKEFATTLGDKAFFAGDMPGYGEAFVFHNIDNAKSIEKDGSTKWAELVGDGWATLEKYHANFAGQPGVKEYLEARGDKCGMPGSIGQV